MKVISHYQLSATAGGLVSCLIWGASIAVLGILAAPLGPLSACGYECLIAGIILNLSAVLRGTFRQMLVHRPRYYLICGGFWMANFSLIWLAVGMIRDPEQLVIVGMFNYLWPILTLLGSVLILGKKAGFLVLPGVLVTVLGLILSKAVLLDLPLFEALKLLLSLFDDNPGAYLCAALCALAWALYSNFSPLLADKKGAGAVPLFMLVTSFLLLAAGRMQGEQSVWTTPVVLVLLLWSIVSAIAYLTWDIGMRKGNIVLISSASMLIPLVSTVITCLLNGIALTAGLVCASLCLVAGAAICKRAVHD